MKSWDVSKLADEGEDDIKEKPVVALEWNPNRSHHCLLAAVGKCAIVIATGTAGSDNAELTDALMSAGAACIDGSKNVRNAKAAKVVKWRACSSKEEEDSSTPISAYGGTGGPTVCLHTTKEVSCVKWHRKGDYFVTVTPKAGAAAVLIHQLSKANSQQPFSKNKGGDDIQCACFHPSKPFLFVASKQQIRIYHLVKQTLVKSK